MNSYRCYFLDKGRIIGVEVLNAAQDDEVIELCRHAHKQRGGNCNGFEIWHGSRFVHRWGPESPEKTQ